MAIDLPEFTYSPDTFAHLPHEGVEIAAFRFRRAAASSVWSEAAMEGNPVTLIDVQTLMDGITVGGHKISDIDQVTRLIGSQRLLHDLVSSGEFTLSADTACAIHAVIAEGEAPDAGRFRGTGTVMADITVSLADGESFKPSPTVAGAQELMDLHERVLQQCASIDRPIARAFHYCINGIYAQFFFDGNKRTARHMMNGEIMSHGYAPLVVNATRAREYHRCVNALFADRNAQPLAELLAASTLDPHHREG